MIETVLVELGRRAIDADGDVDAGLQAGFLDRLHDKLERCLVRFEVGGEAAFITDGGRHPGVVQQLLQRVKHFGAVAQGLAKARRTHRNDHEFLHVDIVVGVRAAVDDVHHRHRQRHRRGAAEVAVERQASLFGGGASACHRYRQQGIGTEARLVVGAVEIDHGLVDEGLVLDVEADDGFADFCVDVLDCLQHALAQITRLVAVAQFDCLAAAGRCA
jgi:hypothetical protein